MNSKKILTITLITLLIAGTLIWWQMDKRSGENSNPNENQETEKVLFKYEASFQYLNSKDNKLLENIFLHFPAPNIDNKIGTDQLSARSWTLEYIDNENTIWLEMQYDAINDNLITTQLKGNRTTQLEILQGPNLEHPSDGPKIGYNLSELYPREQFNIFYYTLVDNENADNLTLLEVLENQRTSAAYYWPSGKAENKRIDLYFDVKLMRSINENQAQIIEHFVRLYENGPSSGYWLYPAQES